MFYARIPRMPELRQNIATKEWVIIAKERAKRPDDFVPIVDPPETEEQIAKCPFCRGHEHLTPPEITSYRSYGTKANSPGWWIRIIPNKFAALGPGKDIKRKRIEDFFVYMDGIGEHEVLIESPNHNDSFALMSQKQVEEIFIAFRERMQALCKDEKYEMIIIFKNHGASAGTSVKHPHSQIIATPVTPQHIRHVLEEAMRYFDDNGECVYCKIIEKELLFKERLVLETENFVSFVPFAAKSPFETWILPKVHCSSFELTSPELAKEAAYVAKHTLGKIYTALKNPDYNLIIHSSPCHEKNVEYFHWLIQIMPRISSVAGFELGSGIYINTVIPEEAAKFLREAPNCLPC